jgi:phosphotransferase family enzyme
LGVDRTAEDWIRGLVKPVGAIEVRSEEAWATVWRVPHSDGVAWFKACARVQAFEPRLTAELAARWPDRVVEVLGHDEDRAWLLLADGGTPVAELGNPPEAWLAALPPYADLQRGEAAYSQEHLAHHVPDMRVAALSVGYEELLQADLPLDSSEVDRLRRFAPRYAELCGELAAYEVPDTVQHDDLHMNNLYARDDGLRVLDWGDASISHPFMSLVVTFRFLEERTKLRPDDPWFARLRDAYLEPWGRELGASFSLAMRVGAFAHFGVSVRVRAALPAAARREFDTDFQFELRRALERTSE